MSAKLSNSPARFPLTNRLTESANWPGVEFRVSREDISAGTDWAIHEQRHAVIVHLEGAINQLETEMDGCGKAFDPPMAGEVWLVPAGNPYASRARGGVISYAELYIEPDFLRELGDSDAEFRELLPQVGRFDEFLHRNVRHLMALRLESDDLSRMMSQTLSRALCLHIFREYAAHNSTTRTTAQSVIRPASLTMQASDLIQDYIQTHLGDPITLEVLAQLAGLSTHNLLTAFRRTFGTTPVQYIIAQRLRRARWLLTNTAKDITTISLETGFASHSHLTSTFKLHTGFTPSQFRSSQTPG